MGTVFLATATFVAFVWFLFGRRRTHQKDSVEPNSLEIRTALPTTNSEFMFEQKNTELGSAKSQNTINSGQTSETDTMLTMDSWKLGGISPIHNSDTNNPTVGAVNFDSCLAVRELHCTRNSITIINANNSMPNETKSEAVCSSSEVSNDYHLHMLHYPESAITLGSSDNPSTNQDVLSKVTVEDSSSSNTFSLSSLETGITVTDATAEVPSTLIVASVAMEPNGLSEAVSSGKDKLESVQLNELMLCSETARSNSEASLNAECSGTKLRSNDITSLLDSDTDDNMEHDSISTSDYTLVKNYLPSNYYYSDLDFKMAELPQKRELDHQIVSSEGGSKSNEAAIEQIQPVRSSTHTSRNERNVDATQKCPEVTLRAVQQEAPPLVSKADASIPESCTPKTPALAPEKAPLRDSALEQNDTIQNRLLNTSKASSAEVPMTPSAPAPPLKESVATKTTDEQKAIIAAQKEPKAEAVLSSPASVSSLKESEAEAQKAEPEEKVVIAAQKEPKAEAVLSSPASVSSLKESEAEAQKAEPEEKVVIAAQKEPKAEAVLSSPASVSSLKESEAEVKKVVSAMKAESPVMLEMPKVEAAGPATPVLSLGASSPKSESASQSKTAKALHSPGVDVDMLQTADVQEEKQRRNEQQKEEEYLPEFSATDEPFKEPIVKKREKEIEKFEIVEEWIKNEQEK
uniref:Uncharacterized protein n=1 Tax=Setaria digitata TaxID=48799 RepID=A0A915Q8D9_9BILA